LTACEEHRPYLAAIADGERELVPASTVDHVRTCASCQREVDTHALLSQRLRSAVTSSAAQRAIGVTLPSAVRGLSRRRAALAVVAVLLTMAVIGGVTIWPVLSGDAQVAAAAEVAGQPAQFSSADPAEIGVWCARTSGRQMPQVTLPQLTPEGARMDRRAGSEIVTVRYRAEDGHLVTVSWLDASPVPLDRRGVEARKEGGRTVLVARSAGGTAVVSGDVPTPVLWRAAAEIQTASF
jgi:hypothetical protein